MNLGYLALELRRALRQPGTVLFVMGFPGGFYLLESLIFQAGLPDAVPFSAGLVVLPAMTAWGVLLAGMLVGTQVVNERAAGWQRQLRLTPLTGAGYLLGKGTVGMLVALPPPLFVALLAALVRDVRLEFTAWAALVGLVWLGGLPFALLGLLIGQLASPVNVQQITIVAMLALSIFGGMFMPLDSLPAWFTSVGSLTPGYWLTELARAAVLPGRDPLTAGGALVGWSVALAAAMMWRYRHDSARD
ncbi:ABC transporter permease [Sphaerisporangium sp. TRM90804]|uniref:ABC transporter permease n=1 Tax=Sphaerisporangium sp. TRM90804 TaxID=3031113 RepID=UPI00244D2E81|nr:ABC transporter permease [Sphaerisporangium sp. TRM90804]MDH2426886.1 ABC transporter permease [Sphaerisporangium sp. TRM90804]